MEVYNRLTQVSDRFGLDIRIEHLGSIYYDEAVPNAVRTQKLFCEAYPLSRASKSIKKIVEHLSESMEPAEIGWGKIFS